MLSTAPLLEASLDGLTLNRRGKVRDVYDIRLASGEDALLIVATDRISAFDYVLGIILASMLARAINGSAPFFGTIFLGFYFVLLHRVLAGLGHRGAPHNGG